MKSLILAGWAMLLVSSLSFAQASFEITGSPIPPALLKQNYGGVPKGVKAYDLSICNVSDTRQSLVSSRVYQALSNSYSSLQPIGRQIMLASILSNQNHSFSNILGLALNSTTGVLSVLSSSVYRLPAGLLTTMALASLSGQQLLTTLKPILSADQVEKFEAQVLEPALVLDGGSCVERTVFVTSATPKANIQPLTFHIR